jgi:hypothetical protein
MVLHILSNQYSFELIENANWFPIIYYYHIIIEKRHGNVLYKLI